MKTAMIPTPIDILENKLAELEYAMYKSEKMYIEHSITSDLYMKHRQNLEPKIKEYKSAIAKLLE